jgi:iron complex outermembrane receptor protein
MLSLRLDRYENKPFKTNGIAAATGDYKQTALSPKFGLVYQVIKDQVALFGNYMNGFSNTAPLAQPDGSISIFKPRHADQIEFGVKTEAFQKRLNLTASYYDIQLTNATRRTDDGFTVQDGTQKSKGFEVEILTNPVHGLNLSAGYGFNDSYYTKATVALEGKKVQAVPEHIYNLWASYKFYGTALKNIGVGLGGNYVSRSFFDAANTFLIPAYKVLNASVFYDRPEWRFGIKGNNLTDTKFWDRYANAQPTRQWLASISFKF